MNSLSPRQILGGFNRRESGAVRWICESYYPDVLSIVKKLTHGAQDAEDLAREIFARLLEHPGRFDGLRKIIHFLYQTTKNACRNYLDHQQVIKSRSGEIERYYQSLSEDRWEEAEIVAAQMSLIYASIEKLPRQCKQVFLLYYTRGFGNREIAGRLHIAEKTVANQRANALRILKAEIWKMSGHVLLLLLYLLP